jgi:hypothetical protein
MDAMQKHLQGVPSETTAEENPSLVGGPIKIGVT